MLRSFFKLLFGNHGSPRRSPTTGDTYTMRGGKSVKADEVFLAWTSGDLERMLRAVELKTNFIDRHFLLMGIVAATYKEREKIECAKLCERIARLHISEFAAIAPALKREMGGSLPRVTTFQHYATLLTEQNRSEEAIEVCQSAISYGLGDGTKSGFIGRIERIKKLASTPNSDEFSGSRTPPLL